MCGKMLTKLFKRSKEQTAPAREPRKWGEFPSRIFSTSLGGPNMPKLQPCPVCRAGAKRQFKTDLGATYLCRCKNRFTVLRY